MIKIRPGPACPGSVVLLVLLSVLVLPGPGRAATPPPESGEVIPFESPVWNIEAREFRIESHLGRSSLFLDGGLAVIEDAAFRDGVIEFEVAFSGQRGFVGTVFRVEDTRNYEQFYLRPHQSGNPDANQYTPVFHGVSGWQLYHGEGYGAPVAYESGVWIPVRIVVFGKRADVYIGQGTRPRLVIPDLKREPRTGGVGLSAGGGYAPAHFSRFRFRAASEDPGLRGRAPRVERVPPGTVKTYLVSRAFPEDRLEKGVRLPSEDRESSWTPIEAEDPHGVVNLARVQGVEGERNTVFARFQISAARARTMEMRFGYSDRVRVYLNDRLLYQGDNTYRSRDYRYLGTIGLFDRLYLPLQPGTNEVWLAVTESFGGWGVMARFEDLADASLPTPAVSE